MSDKPKPVPKPLRERKLFLKFKLHFINARDNNNCSYIYRSNKL